MLVLRVGGIGLGYLLQVFLARWMGASAYGVYTYVFAWASAVALVTGLGLPGAVLRFIPAYRSQSDWAAIRGLQRRGIELTLGLSSAVSLLGTGVILALDAYFGIDETPLLLLGAWAVPVIALMKLQTESLRATRLMVWAYLPALIVRPVLVAGGAYLLLLPDARLTSSEVMAVTLIVMAVVVAVRTRAFRHAFPAELHTTPPRFETRTWLRTSLPLFMMWSFIFIINQADLLMVGIILDATSVGFYRVAARSAAFVTLVLIAVETVTAPTIASTHAQEGVKGLQRLVNHSVHLIFWPSLLVTILLFVFTDFILSLFGPEFVAAAPALKILAIGHLFNAATGIVGYLLNLTGFQDDSARVFGIAAAANILLNGIGIPLFGMTGAALATALTMASSNVWLYVLALRRLGVHASILSALSSRNRT